MSVADKYIEIKPFADLKVMALQADDSACGHYRVVYPMEFLRRGGATVEVATKYRIDQLMEYDTILVQRQYRKEVINTLKELRKHGKTLIYEIDDNVHQVHPNSTAYKVYKPGCEAVRGIDEAMEVCHGLIVTTPELAEMYRGKCQRVYYIPNQIDYGIRNWEDDIPRDPRILAKIEEVKEKTGKEPVVVGWAGSITHQDDWQSLMFMRKTMQDYPEVIFVLVSAYSIMELFVQQLQLPSDRVVTLDPVSIADYPIIPAQFDIGLAATVTTDFNLAKSNLKLLEYGARGVPYVASNIAPYLRFHRETGGFGGTLGFRSDQITFQKLIEDKDVRLQAGQFLKEYIRENYSYDKNVHLWADCFRTVRDSVRYNPHEIHQIHVTLKPQRNDRCPCGCGKKYKACECYGAWGR